MVRSRSLVPMAGLLFAVGAVALSRFSHNLRSVDVVGLSGGGFAIGVGFVFLILGITGRIRP